MALLEDLIAQVEDSQLRAALADEARGLKRRTNFGLVFERHLPESVVLASKIGVSVGDEVRPRFPDSGERRLRVSALRCGRQDCTVSNQYLETQCRGSQHRARLQRGRAEARRRRGRPWLSAPAGE